MDAPILGARTGERVLRVLFQSDADPKWLRVRFLLSRPQHRLGTMRTCLAEYNTSWRIFLDRGAAPVARRRTFSSSSSCPPRVCTSSSIPSARTQVISIFPGNERMPRRLWFDAYCIYACVVLASTGVHFYKRSCTFTSSDGCASAIGTRSWDIAGQHLRPSIISINLIPSATTLNDTQKRIHLLSNSRLLTQCFRSRSLASARHPSHSNSEILSLLHLIFTLVECLRRSTSLVIVTLLRSGSLCFANQVPVKRREINTGFQGTSAAQISDCSSSNRPSSTSSRLVMITSLHPVITQAHHAK
ncbi:hypothetical protein BDN70DRAFT_551388 [Pholiota conissans]|uniref:Uncharacterized protein n=1 Tax=Pholiota conissans TaxID=109636 RepID=A0A9P5YM25_9AGAR|nr:hypothetical protein BDN70DRAFT_551388 [Pholiota conissans]